MKINTTKLPLRVALLGIAALLLRLGLYLAGADAKGLLIPFHPLALLTWAVTMIAAVLIIASVLPLKGSNAYADNFGPSTPAFLGAAALAVGIGLSVVLDWRVGTRLAFLRNVCGLLAIPALAWAGLCRQQGRKPFFGCHGLVCLYLTLYAVSHYQHWCSQPQLQDYFFNLAGSLSLLLFAYHQTAFDADLGKRQTQLAAGLLALFFCLAALACRQDIPLYAAGAIWAATNLAALTPVPENAP